jgi:type I restriction enzyme, R subunit
VLAERVQYMDKTGKLVTESLRDYARKTIRAEYASLDGFLKTWSHADRKTAIVEELQQHGVFFEELAKEVGGDYAPFDLVCHVAFDQKPLTRKQRTENVRKRTYFTKYGEAARKVLDALLDKYADGVDDIENIGVLNVSPLTSLGTPLEIVKAFGGKDAYVQAVRELEDELYGRAS